MPAQDTASTSADASATEVDQKADRRPADRRSARRRREDIPVDQSRHRRGPGHAPDAGVEDAEAAIAAARRAFDTTGWSTDVELRIRCLDQLHQALLDHADELRELTIAEVGATRALTAGRPARRADRDRALLRRPAARLSVLRGPRRTARSRGMQHHRWVEKEAAGRGRRPSSPTTIRTSSRWPSWRRRWPPDAPSCSRARRTRRW